MVGDGAGAGGGGEERSDLTSVYGVAEKSKNVIVRRRACHTSSPRYLIRAESGNVTLTMRSVSLR